MNTFYENRSCSPSLTAKNFTGATAGCRQRSSLVGGRVWVEHPGENEVFRVERHVLYASHAAVVTHWEQQKAAAAGKKAAKAKNKPNPKPDADPPAEPALKPAKPEPKPEAISRPLSSSLKLPLRPPPWRWMPQRTPRPNQQPDHLHKPMPRPRMGAKPRPRPPFGRTRQAPALRCRAA